MIVWILMILDILAVINLSFFHFGLSYSSYFLILSGIYFIAKGLIFRDVMSIIDSVCGIYIFFALLFGVNNFFYYLILFWILYKFISLLINN